MLIARSVLLFALAGLAEIGGGYLMWLRLGRDLGRVHRDPGEARFMHRIALHDQRAKNRCVHGMRSASSCGVLPFAPPRSKRRSPTSALSTQSWPKP
jgi:hypothetical protein